MSALWIDAVEFENRGGWYLDTQFVYEMGQAYLMAADKPGVPVTPAIHSFMLQDSGKYRLWVRTKNWKITEAPGKFKISVDGKELDNICGAMPATKWYWEIAGNIGLEKGIHKLEVNDINPTGRDVTNVDIKPMFPEKLNEVNAYHDTLNGRISVEWKRENGNITLNLSAAEKLHGKVILPKGYTFSDISYEKDLISGEYVLLAQNHKL